MNKTENMRLKISYIFSEYEKVIFPMLKIVAYLIIYRMIFKIGHNAENISSLYEGLNGFIYLVALSVISSIVSIPHVYVLVVFNIFLQMSSMIILAMIFLFVGLSIVFIYARVAKKSVIVMLTVLGILFNVPFVVPIVSGMYYGLTALTPIVIGVFVIGIMELGKEIILYSVKNPSILELSIEGLTELIEYVNIYMAENNFFISNTIAFVTIFLIVYIASKKRVKNAEIISVIISNIVLLIMYFTLLRPYHSSVAAFVLKIFLGDIIIGVTMLFKGVLEYKKVKNLKFKDSKNIYIVKVIPINRGIGKQI